MNQPLLRFPDLNEDDVLCIGINLKKPSLSPKYSGSIWLEIEMDGEQQGSIVAFSPADARLIAKALNLLADRVEGEKATEVGK